MRISLRLTIFLAVLIGFIVSPTRADTICPQPSSPDRASDLAIQSHDFEHVADVASGVGYEFSFRETATGEIHILTNDISGIGDHRADSRFSDLRPTLHVMPKRVFFSDESGGDPIQAPEPRNMLLLACGLTSVLLVRSRITPR